MFKLAIISSLVLLSSFNVYAQEKEQIEVWEEPSKSFAITKAIADFEAINDCEIKLREISSAKQLDVLKEHIKNGERIPDVMVTISDKFGEAGGRMCFSNTQRHIWRRKQRIRCLWEPKRL